MDGGVDDNLHYFQGFWCPPDRIEAVIALQQDFEAHDTDLIISTPPRSGTLWLKSMTFAIVNRTRYPRTSSTSSKHPPTPIAYYFISSPCALL
ncbi:Sulfotransferase domain [Macleaya cordata]|uniref:Sulfotransferase n=1 Tax=Macleaya cordata TaxID=56857 RepID=A0A200R9L6_MACCD|nr:Sulfotransferase domain [Macleaya cordata]